MLKPFFQLLACLLFSYGIYGQQITGYATVASPPSAGFSFLALGDSYTSGEGVARADRWPVQLAALARQQQLNLLTPDLIARTGWTTAALAEAIAAAHPQKLYDLVSLQIGVNDQYRGQSVVRYRAGFRQLLRIAIGCAGHRPGRVFVLSIPDWGQSPFAEGRDRGRTGNEIDAFNAAAHEECQRAGVSFVDITPLTRAAAGDASQFAPDGLHYAGPQLRRWVEAALPVVKAKLNTP